MAPPAHHKLLIPPLQFWTVVLTTSCESVWWRWFMMDIQIARGTAKRLRFALGSTFVCLLLWDRVCFSNEGRGNVQPPSFQWDSRRQQSTAHFKLSSNMFSNILLGRSISNGFHKRMTKIAAERRFPCFGEIHTKQGEMIFFKKYLTLGHDSNTLQSKWKLQQMQRSLQSIRLFLLMILVPFHLPFLP